jgi:hypothetical protein
LIALFTHSQTARWWVSGQDNIAAVASSFDAKYGGRNSFRTLRARHLECRDTVYQFQLTSTTEIFMDFRLLPGSLGDALGLEVSDLDVVPTPGRATCARNDSADRSLSSETVEPESNPW